MTTFSTFEDARKSLVNNKFMPANAPLLDDVAAIAAFLCNPAQFEAALEQVSSSLWFCYMGQPAQSKNKFSRALGMVAENAGFRISTTAGADTGNSGRLSKEPLEIKLIGSDKVFVDMLQGGLFWKDSMNLRHGEYSHALQWLAVAKEFGRRAVAVYKSTADFKSENGVLLWSWLADCFPSNAAGGDEKISAKTAETLKSDTFRSPQRITDYLIGQVDPLPDHFVSYYLQATYKRRGLLHYKQPKHDTNAPKVADYGDLPGHMKEWHKPARWDGAPGNDNRLLRKTTGAGTGTEPEPAPVATKTDATRMTFHGQTGNFYA